jgi:hypothetical protein
MSCCCCHVQVEGEWLGSWAWQHLLKDGCGASRVGYAAPLQSYPCPGGVFRPCKHQNLASSSCRGGDLEGLSHDGHRRWNVGGRRRRICATWRSVPQARTETRCQSGTGLSNVPQEGRCAMNTTECANYLRSTPQAQSSLQVRRQTDVSVTDEISEENTTQRLVQRAQLHQQMPIRMLVAALALWPPRSR